MIESSVLDRLNIAIVDDHDLIREGMHAMLTTQGLKHIDLFSRALELIAVIGKKERYDFYIIDLELSDMDGFALIGAIRAVDPTAAIIVSTAHNEIWTLRKLVALNVNAIIYKTETSTEIVAAISLILQGEHYYCEESLKIMENIRDKSQMPTERELEVLQLISQGKTTKEIAAILYVSENTIEAHRKSLFQKLNVSNVAMLIVKAIEKGILKTGNFD